MNRQDNHSFNHTQYREKIKNSTFWDFYEALQSEFQMAEGASDNPLHRYYKVGGLPILLRFANSALLPFIAPALEHLTVPPHPSPALTICLWDNVSTNTSLPPLPWLPENYVTRGGIFTYRDDRLYAALYSGIQVLNMLDAERNLALFCIRDASRYPSFQVSSPLLVILHWGLRKYGLQFVHAAAVGTPTLGGVLIVGKGGSGKSTAALSCLSSELRYVSDDYCLLSASPNPYAHNLYGSAKVDGDALHTFPQLAPFFRSLDQRNNNKRVIFLHQHYPEKLIPGFPIRAVLVPSITGRGETKLSVTSPAIGLRALAPSTIFQLSGADEGAFQIMAECVRKLPCYNLELGTDLSAIPEVILSLLADVINS